MRKLLNKTLLMCVIVGFIVYPGIIKGQDFDKDAEVLVKHKVNNSFFQKRKLKFGFFESEKEWIKYNPVTFVFSAMMYAYQGVISRHFSASCLYHPSCSEFSKELIKEYGLVKGVACSADRLTRCNRLSAMDFTSGDVNEHDKKIHESVDYYNISQDKRIRNKRLKE